MTDILLSLVCPTARAGEVCRKMAESIKTNLNMEIIFVGPINVLADRPVLPFSYNFIVSKVKPVQCWQIGMHHARGETVGLVADDERFLPYSWDEAYAKYKQANNYKTIVSLNWWEPANQDNLNRFADRNPNIKTIGSSSWYNFKPLLLRFGFQLPNGCSVMSRKFFNELGGYDRKFIRRMADLDFFTGAIKDGANIQYCAEGGVFEDYWPPIPTDLPNFNPPSDYELYESKWKMENGVLTQKILTDFFEWNENIYTISQGTNCGYP